MVNEEFSFSGTDKKSIHAYLWNNVENPKAVLQIFHGMAEHAGRYADFAGFLNKRGYAVYADDHRGHGKTVRTLGELGYVGKDGFNMTVEDEYILNGIIKKRHGSLPVFVLGHSYGSFLAQEYILRYSGEIAGALLTGSAMKSGADVKAGYAISSVMLLLGEKKKNMLIDKMSFSGVNEKVVNPKTGSEWLSRDESEVDKYIKDPFCGEVFTTNFYHCFLKGLSRLYKRDRLAKIQKDIPIHILSGGNDPIGSYGSSPGKLFEMYRQLGIRDVSLKLFEGCRHEILNETNKLEVYDEIAAWLDRHLS